MSFDPGPHRDASTTAAAPARRPRMLLVSNVPPWLVVRNGGGQRTAILWRAAESLGFDVDLDIHLHEGMPLPSVQPQMPQGRSYRQSVRTKPDEPGPPAIERWLGPLGKPLRIRRTVGGAYESRYRATRTIKNLRDYDVVLCRYTMSAMQAGLHLQDDVPVLLDLDDVDWLTLAAQLSAEPWPGIGGRIGMKAALAAVRRAAAQALPSFAGGFVACAEDVAAVEAAGLAAQVLPNIPVDGDALTEGRVETPAPLPPLAEPVPRKVLFVGDLRHGPNHDGLARFLREGWPVVQAANAGIRLQIIGRGLDEIDAGTRADWAGSPGVEVTGYVDDLRGAYAGAAMTIAPTWWGGGTKIKVVESAAMGRFCLATEQACRGYGVLTEGDCPPVQVSSTAEAMGRTILRKFDKPGELRTAALAGPKQVEQCFSLEAARDVLRAAVLRVLPEGILPGKSTSPLTAGDVVP